MTTREELPPDHAPKVRFERRDVNARALLMIGLGACVCMVLFHVGLLKLFQLYRAQEDRHDSLPSPMMTGESQRIKSFATLQELRRSEERRLNSYDWVDHEKREVRIPIDRAIELSVERGLPDWQTKSGAKSSAKKDGEPERTP